VIVVNDRVVEQFPLASSLNSFRHRVEIPVRLLKAGYNKVQVRAIQHYSDQCEYPLAPQLWTQINTSDSSFIIDAEPSKLDPKLSQLNVLFDRASWQEQVTVPVFAPDRQSPALLATLGHVAQGVAQRYDFVPIMLTHQVLPDSLGQLKKQMGEASVAIVTGNKTELQKLLDLSDYEQRKGPGIAIQQLDGKQKKYLVLLFADDDAGLRNVARAFAIPSIPWPDESWVSINQLELPDRQTLEQRFSIPTQTSGAFPLRALGYQSRTLTGMDAESIKLNVWNNTWQGRMQVRVHMAYASGMARQSALNILTNGVLNGSIPMSNPQGGAYENYAVTIPAGVMQPGWNELEFQPVMLPQSNGGECQPFFSGNLATTIYADSTVQKFGGDELRKRDLSMLNGRGYLFTGLPLGKDVAVYLASNDSHTVSAAMTLMAKLSQVYKRPLLNAYFGEASLQQDAEQHFWVGALAELPESVAKSVNHGLPEHIQLNVPLVQSAGIRVHEGAEWLNELMDKMGLRKTPPTNLTEADVTLEGGMASKVFAVSTEIEDSRNHIVFTASEPAKLKAGIDTLVDYSHWGQLRGLVAFWQPGAESIQSIGYNDAPFSAFGLRGGLGIWVSQYPWRALFVLLLFLGGVIWLTRRVLSQYRQTHHQ
jgi:hypothetical protein